MKYTAKIKQAQLVGKIRIEPKGGDLNADQVTEIKKDPWGKDLIRKGFLVIEGVKPSDIVDEPKKGSVKQDTPATADPTQTANGT
jgi:hypothetical protein